MKRLLMVGLLALLPASAVGQIPDEFTNLQFFDQDIDKRQLIGAMRGFAGALGVRCNYCHPGGEGDSLQGVDFATDENPHKVIARAMLRMTAEINQNHVAGAVASDSPVQVQCVTCHRGQARPVLIADALREANQDGGANAVKEKYSSLRDEYYGSHTFDFQESVLPSFAEGLLRSGDTQAGLDLLEFNLSFYPESSYTHIMMAQAKHQLGDVDGAIAALETAIELDPDNEWAKNMLERAKASQE